MKLRKAQSMAEYAVLIAVFLAAIIAGQFYLKRAITGRMKSSSDSISTEQFGKGYLENSWSQASSYEVTGTGATEHSRSTLAADISGTGIHSHINVGYVGGQVTYDNAQIDYNLKGGTGTIFNE